MSDAFSGRKEVKREEVDNERCGYQAKQVSGNNWDWTTWWFQISQTPNLRRQLCITTQHQTKTTTTTTIVVLLVVSGDFENSVYCSGSVETLKNLIRTSRNEDLLDAMESEDVWWKFEDETEYPEAFTEFARYKYAEPSCRRDFFYFAN